MEGDIGPMFVRLGLLRDFTVWVAVVPTGEGL